MKRNIATSVLTSALLGVSLLVATPSHAGQINRAAPVPAACPAAGCTVTSSSRVNTQYSQFDKSVHPPLPTPWRQICARYMFSTLRTKPADISLNSIKYTTWQNVPGATATDNLWRSKYNKCATEYSDSGDAWLFWKRDGSKITLLDLTWKKVG